MKIVFWDLTMEEPLSSSVSPNWIARFDTAWATDSTLIFSLYVNQWCCASTLALSIRVRESAIRPLTAQPMWRSTSTIFLMVEGSMREDVILFSTARTMPSEVEMPIAVEPSLIASMAYSTYKSWIYQYFNKKCIERLHTILAVITILYITLLRGIDLFLTQKCINAERCYH